MSQLAQQELLEPPARRRIIVPAGEAAHWGVDPSSQRVAVATVRPSADGYDRTVQLASFARLGGAAQLSVIYAETVALGRALAAQVPPGVVVVEQPSGKQVNHELEAAVGVITAALYDGVYSALGHGVRFETIPSSTWKKLACGRGNIYKPTRARLGRTPVVEDYEVLRWAWESGMPRELSSWDAADSWGIAEAARRDIALEER